MSPKDAEHVLAAKSSSSSGQNTAATDAWTPCGAHRIRVIDDTFMIELHGEFTRSDLDQYFFHAESIHKRYGYFLILGDISDGVTLSAPVRKRSVEWIKNLAPSSAMAVIGAGLPARAVVTLAVQAIRIFSRQDYNMEFFKSEAAGRDWLARQRLQLSQKNQSK